MYVLKYGIDGEEFWKKIKFFIPNLSKYKKVTLLKLC